MKKENNIKSGKKQAHIEKRRAEAKIRNNAYQLLPESEKRRRNPNKYS